MAIDTKGGRGRSFKMAAQIGRVPSFEVPLDRVQELRFAGLMESLILIDLNQHLLMLPEDPAEISDYFRSTSYRFAYEAARHGGWTAVCTGNGFSCMKISSEASFADFADLVAELGLMLADFTRQGENIVKVARTRDIMRAKQSGRLALVPTVEHLAIAHDVYRVDVLYGIGVRMAGLTFRDQNYIGGGEYETRDRGLTDLGREVVRRMNDLGMVVDICHAGRTTAMETIELSRVPVTFSHTIAYGLRQSRKARQDEELLACTRKGGIVGILAVPNSLSDDPNQDINVYLDQFDYLVKLVGIDHVAIGSDTLVGDAVGFQKHVGGEFLQEGRLPRGSIPARTLAAPYLKGFESGADGKNLVRGLIARGYSDDQIAKLCGLNVVRFFDDVIG
jgi:membrane dipeptidase